MNGTLVAMKISKEVQCPNYYRVDCWRNCSKQDFLPYASTKIKKKLDQVEGENFLLLPPEAFSRLTKEKVLYLGSVRKEDKVFLHSKDNLVPLKILFPNPVSFKIRGATNSCLWLKKAYVACPGGREVTPEELLHFITYAC